ncbi:MAG: DNA-binding protein [Proteobacteria bacterium]|nr:DNA-binding protein [Pseudomonadota bacterium]
MKATQAGLGRVFVLRLEDGDRVPESIDRFAREHGIQRAVCTLLGSFAGGRLVSGPREPDARPVECFVRALEGVHESAGVGTIFPGADGAPRRHLHATLGRDDRARTGCAREGLDVGRYGEVVILELLGPDWGRYRDADTEFELLGPKDP